MTPPEGIENLYGYVIAFLTALGLPKIWNVITEMNKTNRYTAIESKKIDSEILEDKIRIEYEKKLLAALDEKNNEIKELKIAINKFSTGLAMFISLVKDEFVEKPHIVDSLEKLLNTIKTQGVSQEK